MDTQELTTKLLQDLMGAFKRSGILRSNRFNGPTRRRRTTPSRGYTKSPYNFAKQKRRRKIADASRKINRSKK